MGLSLLFNRLSVIIFIYGIIGRLAPSNVKKDRNILKTINLLFTALILTSCSTTYPNQKLVGKTFPSVKGNSLEGNSVSIPEDFKGQPTIILIGYKMESQFDIDRWLIGLDMTQTKAAVYEIPTIAGLFPEMFSTTIDNGMRKGIPKEIWKGVITIYEDGAKVQEFTGNENPNNTRVILLDKNGVIQFFHDRGFAVTSMNELKEKLNSLQ